jgi:hypothetical protein
MEEEVIFIIRLLIFKPDFLPFKNVIANRFDDTIDPSITGGIPSTCKRATNSDGTFEIGMCVAYAGEVDQLLFVPEDDEEFGEDILIECYICLFLDLVIGSEK